MYRDEGVLTWPCMGPRPPCLHTRKPGRQLLSFSKDLLVLAVKCGHVHEKDPVEKFLLLILIVLEPELARFVVYSC